MASYMYTSVSGKNWDDDDDDFDSAVYSGAVAELGAPEKAKSTLSNARLALQELEKESTIEFEQQHARNSTSTVMQSKVDYNNIDKDYWPTSAGHATQSWFSSGPPAYTALSTDRGYVYPYERRNYNANWMTTKLRMSANMKRTAMMAPSNFNLSKTWVSDSLGEYVEDRGYEYLSLPTLRTSTPRLAHENESDEERDEAQTPPDTPSMAKAGKCDVEVEYDPTTDAVDLHVQNVKSMETEMAHGFANFSSIAEDLSVDQILGDARQRVLNAETNEDALRLLVSNLKARSTVELTTVTAEAILAVPSQADEAVEITPAAYKQSGSSNVDSSNVSTDSNSITRTSAVIPRKPSPDIKYIIDPTNTSLIWNTVAAGWFALSSLPWGRMAVTAAGGLVDVAVFIARH